MDHTRRHRRLLLAGALTALFAPALRAQGRLAPAPLINAASRLAMLVERIAKLHAQVGRDVLAVRSRRGLREAIGELERGLTEVSAAVQSTELRDNYRLMRVLWEEFRPAALQAPSSEGARRLAERTEELAWIASKGARFLHEQAHTRAGELLMAAGTARAAAPRLGKLHLLRGWALAANAAPRDVKLAEGEILLALASLRSAVENRDEVAPALAMAEDQLAFLRQAVQRLGQGKDRALQLEHIAKSADHIAETMDRVARRYETIER